MKKLTLFFIYPCLYVSCNQNEENTNAIPAAKNVSIEPMISITPVVLQKPLQVFVPADKPREIVTAKGVGIMVDPAALETFNGKPIGKQIEVRVKEPVKTDEEPGNLHGEKLVVPGAVYYVEFASAGNKLKLKNGRKLQVKIPSVSGTARNLYYVQEDSANILHWKLSAKK